MANKITVKFEAQGDKALEKAINSLARAQKKLGVETNKYGKSLKGLNKETDKKLCRRSTNNF